MAHSSVNNYSRFEAFLLFFPRFSPTAFFPHKLFVLLINIQLVKLNVLSAQLSSVECRLSYS